MARVLFIIHFYFGFRLLWLLNNTGLQHTGLYMDQY